MLKKRKRLSVIERMLSLRKGFRPSCTKEPGDLHVKMWLWTFTYYIEISLPHTSESGMESHSSEGFVTGSND
jgi:hypothetical protein